LNHENTVSGGGEVIWAAAERHKQGLALSHESE
jgi:hypothetical protein